MFNGAMRGVPQEEKEKIQPRRRSLISNIGHIAMSTANATAGTNISFQFPDEPERLIQHGSGSKKDGKRDREKKEKRDKRDKKDKKDKKEERKDHDEPRGDPDDSPPSSNGNGNGNGDDIPREIRHHDDGTVGRLFQTAFHALWLYILSFFTSYTLGTIVELMKVAAMLALMLFLIQVIRMPTEVWNYLMRYDDGA